MCVLRRGHFPQSPRPRSFLHPSACIPRVKDSSKHKGFSSRHPQSVVSLPPQALQGLAGLHVTLLQLSPVQWSLFHQFTMCISLATYCFAFLWVTERNPPLLTLVAVRPLRIELHVVIQLDSCYTLYLSAFYTLRS